MMNEEFNLFVSELGYDVDDIYSVTYFTDVFELENNKLIFRHIDIDFINGEFLELNDTDKRYQRCSGTALHQGHRPYRLRQGSYNRAFYRAFR